MAIAIDNMAIRTVPVPAQKAKSESSEPKRIVDVAQFHNLPAAGTPMVSAAEDPTLANLDPVNKIFTKVAERGGVFAKGVAGIRLLTEVLGPVMWGASAFMTTRLFFKSLKDETIALPSKVALGVATVANTAGAGFAFASTRFASRWLSLGARMTANKIAGILGGIGGNIWGVINLVETLRNKDAKPAERFFAKIGFGIGIIGFVFGTAAMCASMPWMAGITKALPWLLPNATRICNITGFVGMFAWIGQMFLGKNAWLGNKVKGTILG
ncbi:MAG: hypothetical protein JWM80_6368 [Cyanobacteria bacterium RYN_339]|nr:hypothetical protein [Cyanobacteria bacterium RYN_339]